MNDSFLNAGTKYNTDAARRHTLCHELGHTIGPRAREHPVLHEQ